MDAFAQRVLYPSRQVKFVPATDDAVYRQRSLSVSNPEHDSSLKMHKIIALFKVKSSVRKLTTKRLITL